MYLSLYLLHVYLFSTLHCSLPFVQSLKNKYKFIGASSHVYWSPLLVKMVASGLFAPTFSLYGHNSWKLGHLPKLNHGAKVRWNTLGSPNYDFCLLMLYMLCPYATGSSAAKCHKAANLMKRKRN